MKIFTKKSRAASFSFFMILLYFWKFSKIQWCAFRLQRPSRNHSLHLQLRGKNTPPNYFIDYGFPLQTWKEVNSLLLATFNNQLFRGAARKKLLFSNKRVKSVQVDTSKGDKEHCMSVVFITEEYDQKQLCDQVKPSARMDICALVVDAFTDPSIVIIIAQHHKNWTVHTENALKCPTNRFWMNACWPYRTPQIKLKVNNY